MASNNGRPTTHQADLAKLPRALAPPIERAQWCNWRWTLKDGKWQKEPFQVAQPQWHPSTNDSSTWATYPAALEVVLKGNADGLSYGLIKNDLLAAIDLDNVRDPDTGSIDCWAQNFMQFAVATYQEASVSGTGVHIWGTAEGETLNRKFTLNIDGKDVAAELFRRAPKILTISGNTLDLAIRKLTNIDRVINWGVNWGERRKAEAAEAKQKINGNGFNGSGGSGRSVDEWETLLRYGVSGGENRSEVFQGYVWHRLGCGDNVEQIIAAFEQYPDGLGSRYIAAGRLEREVNRSAGKRPGNSAAVKTAPTAPALVEDARAASSSSAP